MIDLNDVFAMRPFARYLTTSRPGRRYVFIDMAYILPRGPSSISFLATASVTVMATPSSTSPLMIACTSAAVSKTEITPAPSMIERCTP